MFQTFELELKSTFAYIGIRVKNLEESVDFYTRLLGMKEKGRGSVASSGGQVVYLGTEEGQQLELNYYPPGSKYGTPYLPGEALDHLAFKVDDLDKALEESSALGFSKVLEIKAESRWAYIQDPNGIFIELFA
jgi:lactoylglutathione lyase